MFEHVVRGVVDATETDGGPGMIPFGGVIKDDVEEHLNASAVKGFDHVTELVYWPKRVPTRAVCLVGSKEGNGGVAPVID